MERRERSIKQFWLLDIKCVNANCGSLSRGDNSLKDWTSVWTSSASLVAQTKTRDSGFVSVTRTRPLGFVSTKSNLGIIFKWTETSRSCLYFGFKQEIASIISRVRSLDHHVLSCWFGCLRVRIFSAFPDLHDQKAASRMVVWFPFWIRFLAAAAAAAAASASA